MSSDQLPSWRQTSARRSITEYVKAVTDPGSAEFVAEPERVAVFDNDGTLWTEQPLYAQLAFALDRAAELGHPTSLEKLQADGRRLVDGLPSAPLMGARGPWARTTARSAKRIQAP